MTTTADCNSIQSLRERDANALVSLYDEYGPAVFSVFFEAIRDERQAEDLTHGLFVKVWNQPDLLEDIPLLQLAADMANRQHPVIGRAAQHPKIFNIVRQFVTGFIH